MSSPAPAGGEEFDGEEVGSEDLPLPFVWQDSRVDFNYPLGTLIFAAGSAASQVVFVAKLEGQVLAAVPFSSWHRRRNQRLLPPDALTKVISAEVATADPEDRMVLMHGENLKLWLGFLREDLVPDVAFLSPDDEAHLSEEVQIFSLDGYNQAWPSAQALVDVGQDHFAFFTVPEELGELPEPPPALAPSGMLRGEGSGSPDLSLRVQKLEDTVGTMVAQEPPATAYPLLDPAMVRSALSAGMDEKVLVEMQSLMASAAPTKKKLKEPRQVTIKPSGPLSETEEDEAEQQGSGSAGLSSDPMTLAVGKLTSIVETLAADKERRKKPGLDLLLDGAHGPGDPVSSGSGKRSSIARRALMKALTHSPQELFMLIEKLMEEDLQGRVLAPGMPPATLSARAWMEHRSYIGQYKTLAHSAWGISGVLDCLIGGRVDEARARANLMLLQLDQVAADRGSWQLASLLSLESLPPFANLATHHPPDVSMGEQPFSKLLDPRWSEVALAQLKETDEYLEKRRKLQQKGGRKEEGASGEDSPSPKRRPKAKGQPFRRGENTATPDQ
ncbi:Endoglucanase [Durusdinium trenchii]|uniref:Endoglucanase n=1 Tax=Durusdinium trenchii TaxID=1381693 RepID=A0ABP0HNT0_9DINO